MTKTRTNVLKALLAAFVCAIIAVAVFGGISATSANAAATEIAGGKLFFKEEIYGGGWNGDARILIVEKKSGTTSVGNYDYVLTQNRILRDMYNGDIWMHLYYGVEDGEYVNLYDARDYNNGSNFTVDVKKVKGEGDTSKISINVTNNNFAVNIGDATDEEALITISATLPGSTTSMGSVSFLYKVIPGDDDAYTPLTISNAQEANTDYSMILFYYGNGLNLGYKIINLETHLADREVNHVIDHVYIGKNAVGDSEAVAPMKLIDYNNANNGLKLNIHVDAGWLQIIKYSDANRQTGFERGEYIILKKGFMLPVPGTLLPTVDSDGRILSLEQDLKFVFNLSGSPTEPHWTEVYGIKSVNTSKEEESVETGKTVDLSEYVSVEGNVKIADGGEYNTDVVWKSEDESVATVANGVVTGVAKGTTFVVATSATDSSKSARIKITVISDNEVGALNFTADWSSYKVINLDLGDDAKKSAIVKCYVSGGSNANLAVTYKVNQEGVVEIATAEKTDEDGTKYTEITVTAKKNCNGARVTITSAQNTDVSNFFTVNVTGTAPANNNNTTTTPKKKGCGSSVAGVSSLIVALGLLASATVVFTARKKKEN